MKNKEKIPIHIESGQIGGKLSGIFQEPNKIPSKRELILVITRRCNLSCAHCPVEKKNKDLSEKRAREVIDIFLAHDARRDAGALKIRFFGGEPFLQWEKIKRLIKYANQGSKKITFDITTGGASLNGEILKFIAEQGNVELIISFHRNIFLKKIKPYLDEINKTGKVLFNLKVDPESVRDLFRDFMFLHSQGINRFNILPAYYVLWKKNEISGLSVQFRKILWYIRLEGKEKFYIKNVHVCSEVPLFNSAPVLDVDGKMYSSNIVLDSKLKRIKKLFYLENMESKGSAETARRKHLELLGDSLEDVFGKEVLEDTFLVDYELSRFVKNLKK
jgi:sulfatase maturation enzyme AslB (radical SAM superfamily)